MKFNVRDTRTGKLVMPFNYYFVIKQNGELYIFNGRGEFKKAGEQYKIEI